jgi:hypothetical protein
MERKNVQKDWLRKLAEQDVGAPPNKLEVVLSAVTFVGVMVLMFVVLAMI